LFNKLINIVIYVNILLILLRDKITQDYYKFQTTIDLIFIINSITKRLKQYKSNTKIKNFLDYLLVETIIDLRVQKNIDNLGNRSSKFKILRELK